MSKCYLQLWFFCLATLVFSGCAQKTTVVLLADPDGRIGNLSVATDAGAVDMNQASEATVVSGRGSNPGKPEILTEKQIASQFSVVLAALPAQPEHFLLYFDKGATTLTVESQEMLPQILQSIKTRASESISVIGHSDTVGDREYNLRLSRERAAAVSQVLVREGVVSGHIAVTSHGKENPLVKTGDNVEEPKNRRVEVIVK
jgi:outer membrane protein OmpA-like peptidoglycan-associated protein